MSNCRSCGAKIIWVKNEETEKSHPCDPELVSADEAEDGMTLVGEDGKIYRNAGTNVLDDEMLYRVSHFATCPDADKWRRK